MSRLADYSTPDTTFSSTSRESDLPLLERAFGGPLQLWTKSPAWAPQELYAVDAPADQDAGPLVAAALDLSFCADRPTLTPLVDGRQVLMIPLARSEPTPCAAVSVLHSGEPSLLLRLACAALLAVDQQRELYERQHHADMHVRQVCRDFEELTWLRRLAESLDYRDVGGELRDLAQDVLPSLCEVIEAETVVLVLLPRPDSSDMRHRQETNPQVVWIGRRLCDESACHRMVDQLGDPVTVQPVVCNSLCDRPDLRIADEIHSCVIAPLSKGQSLLGWLLALNKRESDTSADNDEEYLREPAGGSEFGTFEAGLLGAAAVMIATHGRNIELFRDREALLIGVIRAMINAIDAKDPYTSGHSDRVALIARRIAIELGLEQAECERVYMAGLLHDVGKIGMPDQLLAKPAKLSADEFETLKKHPQIGQSIMMHLKQLRHVLPGVLHHHEMVDGRGYPHGLRGDEIPLSARILAVADAYDAMTSTRPYRNAMPWATAEALLRKNAGSQWDAQVVEAFFRAMDDVHEICRRSSDDTHRLLSPDDETTVPLGRGELDSIEAAVVATER